MHELFKRYIVPILTLESWPIEDILIEPILDKDLPFANRQVIIEIFQDIYW